MTKYFQSAEHFGKMNGFLMDQQVGEHETKFVFPGHLADKLAFWLKDRCIPDREYPEGIVSSIYFDTRDWSLLHEKINSDYCKTKIRIRWYSDLATGRPLAANFLEVKRKIGSSRMKMRLESGLDTAWIAEAPLSHEAFLRVSLQLRRHGVFSQSLMIPTLQIDYTRMRFVDGLTGARLCLDSGIRSSRCNLGMLGRSRPYALRNGVFEIKELSGRLPDWLHQLTAFNCRRASFSKYSACWQQATNLHF